MNLPLPATEKNRQIGEHYRPDWGSACERYGSEFKTPSARFACVRLVGRSARR
jgi:hypothetical protein